MFGLRSAFSEKKTPTPSSAVDAKESVSISKDTWSCKVQPTGNFTVLVVQTWDSWLCPFYVMTSSYVAHLQSETRRFIPTHNARFLSTHNTKTRVYSAFQEAMLWDALNTWYQPDTSEASHAIWSPGICGYCFQHCLPRDNPFGHTITKPLILSACSAGWSSPTFLWPCI